MSKPPTGGRPHDDFVFEHFIALEKNPSTKHWTMRCKYCPDATPTIIHRGMLRNHYMRQLSEQALAMGKSTHRKHAHMHTLTEKGIDIIRATELIDNLTIPTPFVTGYDEPIWRDQRASLWIKSTESSVPLINQPFRLLMVTSMVRKSHSMMFMISLGWIRYAQGSRLEKLKKILRLSPLEGPQKAGIPLHSLDHSVFSSTMSELSLKTQMGHSPVSPAIASFSRQGFRLAGEWRMLSGVLPSTLALIDQWIHLTESEVDGNASLIGLLLRGPGIPYSKQLHLTFVERQTHALKTLNAHLASRTFFVGERITLADIYIAVIVQRAATVTLDAALRAEVPYLMRHVETVVNQPEFEGIVTPVGYVEEAVQYVAPKKEFKK